MPKLALGAMVAAIATGALLLEADFARAADPLPGTGNQAQGAVTASYQPRLAGPAVPPLTPAAPNATPAIDCFNQCPPGFEATWRALTWVPDFQEWAQGEYVGRARLPHVPVYRLRVDDSVEFVFRVDRNQIPGQYKINVGDELSIESTNDAELQRTLPVLPDGTIILPLIGKVEAAGQTVGQLHGTLVDRFKKYYNEPEITVTPTRANSQLEELRFAIAGRSGFGGQSIPSPISEGDTSSSVTDPVGPRRPTESADSDRFVSSTRVTPFGTVRPFPNRITGAPLEREMQPRGKSLAEVIEQRAQFGIRVTPEGTVTLPAVGVVAAQGLTIDEFKMELDQRYAEEIEGIEVVPVLRARAPRYVYVLGEVQDPGQHSLEGPTTVMQAISMAGGWNVGARIKNVVVFRRADDWRLIATKLDMRAALLGNAPCPAEEIWVGDADLIIVPKSKLLRTTDFIDLVFTRGIYGVIPADYFVDYAVFRGLMPFLPIVGP